MAEEQNEPEAQAAEEAVADEQSSGDDESVAAEEPAPEEPTADASESVDVSTGDEAPEAATVAETPPKPAPKKAAPRKPKVEKKPEKKPRPKKAPEAAGVRKPIVRLPKPERERRKSKERRGVVVSSAMDKTVVVRVDTVRPHPAYKKVVRHSTKFHAHDEQNTANVGDVVRIVETRPISKTKTWRLAEILEAAK